MKKEVRTKYIVVVILLCMLEPTLALLPVFSLLLVHKWQQVIAADVAVSYVRLFQRALSPPMSSPSFTRRYMLMTSTLMISSGRDGCRVWSLDTVSGLYLTQS